MGQKINLCQTYVKLAHQYRYAPEPGNGLGGMGRSLVLFHVKQSYPSKTVCIYKYRDT